MTSNKHPRTALLWIILALIGCLPLSSAEQKSTTYIWDFSMRDRTKTDITRSLTDAFEIALKKTGKFRILERRSRDRLEYQGEIEKALTDTAQVSEATKRKFQTEGADSVIFGEVYDDVESGEYWVTVTKENWQNEKELIERVSFKRGLRLDESTRSEAMEQLARKFVGSAAPLSQKAKSTTAAQPNAAIPTVQNGAESTPSLSSNEKGGRPSVAPVLSQAYEGFEFTLLSCELRGGTLTCNLEITGGDTDKPITLLVQPGRGVRPLVPLPITAMYDTSNRKFLAQGAMIGNVSGGQAAGQVMSHLVAGTTAKAQITFLNVPITLTRIAKLEIWGGFNNRKPASINFRDVEVSRR